MKIAYVITLPDLGGAQSHVKELMENMRSMYAVTPVLITGKTGWLTEQAEKLHIETHIIPDLVREIAPAHDWNANRELQKLFRQIQPDLVHCHSSKAGILGRWAAKQCGIPSVFTAHGWAFTDGVPETKRKIYRLAESIAGSWCKKIICVSEYDRQLALREIPALKNKLVTVHNCIPDTKYQKDWKQFSLQKPIEIVTVARFSPQKRIMESIDLMKKAMDAHLPFHLTFIGEGPLYQQAISHAAQLGVSQVVTFLGARTDVEELLPRYDLFLLLSNWEGFPISILEAMRAGLPIMASDVGGVNEAVQDGENGWLIPRDESHLLQLLSKLSKDERQLMRLGNKSRILFNEHFHVVNMIRQIWNDVYC